MAIKLSLVYKTSIGKKQRNFSFNANTGQLDIFNDFEASHDFSSCLESMMTKSRCLKHLAAPDWSTIIAVAITKEIIHDKKAIQWNRNITATIPISCGTSYQNCSCYIPIPLNRVVVKDYFLCNYADRTAIALVGRGSGAFFYRTRLADCSRMT